MLNLDFLHIIFYLKDFYGVNKKERKLTIESIKQEEATVIFYEAPHKLLNTLKEIYDIIGDRKICIARELTKIHEEFNRILLSEAINFYTENNARGEIVLLIEGVSRQDKKLKLEEIYKEKNVLEAVNELVKEGISKKDAIKKVAKLKNIDKNEVYKECIDI